MTITPLPREGASTTEVRVAAWQHAHRAHVLLLEAAEVAEPQTGSLDDANVVGQLLAAADTHARVALALHTTGGSAL